MSYTCRFSLALSSNYTHQSYVLFRHDACLKVHTLYVSLSPTFCHVYPNLKPVGIQNLGQSSSSTPGRVIEGDKDLLSPDLIKIPWTIENKYYSADVHFAAHPMRGLAPYLLQNVPAVIFVWGSDEVCGHLTFFFLMTSSLSLSRSISII